MQQNLPLIEATRPTALSPIFVCRRCNGRSYAVSRNLNRISILHAGTINGKITIKIVICLFVKLLRWTSRSNLLGFKRLFEGSLI